MGKAAERINEVSCEKATGVQRNHSVDSIKEEAMKSGNWTRTALALLGTLCCAFVISTNAQVQTTTSTTAGKTTMQVQVERGTVVLVDGNDLVVQMEDGTIRHFPNLPESAKVNVDGNELGVHDLKPGMKLQRSTITSTTPQTITTVQTVTGKVWHVMPPVSVILTLEDGTNQKFNIPTGQQFTINGEQVDAFGLKKGMVVTATKIVEVPETHVSHEKYVSGTMPAAPPPAPPADVPMLIAASPAETAPTTTLATTLPKTGSDMPLVGLLGLLLVSASLGLKLLRARH
jgi:LPXTG-motif cell wall-anchored protein